MDLQIGVFAPPRAVADTEDPDPDSRWPITAFRPKRTNPGKIRGKVRAEIVSSDEETDSDDDCVEVLDATPLSYAYPLQSTAADSDDQVHVAVPLNMIPPTSAAPSSSTAARPNPPAPNPAATGTAPPERVGQKRGVAPKGNSGAGGPSKRFKIAGSGPRKSKPRQPKQIPLVDG